MIDKGKKHPYMNKGGRKNKTLYVIYTIELERGGIKTTIMRRENTSVIVLSTINILIKWNSHYLIQLIKISFGSKYVNVHANISS
jgi:hypothetical protein